MHRCSVGMRMLKDFTEQSQQGNDTPVFDPAKFPDLDINTNAWQFDPSDK